jgi:hypothetical protein
MRNPNLKEKYFEECDLCGRFFEAEEPSFFCPDCDPGVGEFEDLEVCRTCGFIECIDMEGTGKVSYVEKCLFCEEEN